ncbi:MAG: patatin-like phospholipase family protein [Bauldia sp.]|nr:patatin-like phospholipase family protein [Bauldia sp.]
MLTGSATTDAPSPPRSILALDGGGVRGIVSIAFLERIETLLGERAGRPVRLAEAFDLIGGTSTGAIIGTALALGYPVREIGAFYRDLVPKVFVRSRFRLKLIQTIFDADALESEIAAVVGDRRLDSPDLRTSLAIVMKRLDTGSPWLVTNNPAAKYWADPPDGSYVGNRHYRLADLVRASTAAPYYFAPHEVPVAENTAPGLFVDGGMTPYNNPVLALLQLATVPAYGFGWPTGAERLRIVSVGTGLHRLRLGPAAARRMPAAMLAVEALRGMSADGSDVATTMMELLGHSDTSWPLNSESGDLGGFRLPAAPLFSFARYNVRLDSDWLHRELGIRSTDAEIAELAELDNAAGVQRLYEIGVAAAEKFVRPEHVALPEPRPAA